MSDAEIFRRQKAASTDPDRLEREARMAEAREAMRLEGYTKVCDMPGDGPWTMVHALGDLVAVSVEHGAYRLVVEANGGDLTGRWEKIDPDLGGNL
jgi:hypothetical protein